MGLHPEHGRSQQHDGRNGHNGVEAGSPRVAHKPQAQHTRAAHQSGQEELPLIEVVHQRQRRPGGHQPEQHPHSCVLEVQNHYRADQQNPGSGNQSQLQARFFSFIQAQDGPHHTGSHGRQAHPLQDRQARIDGKGKIDRFRRSPVVDIITIHKHQKKFQDDRRSNPDQGPVQVPILLAPTRLSLIIIHVP